MLSERFYWKGCIDSIRSEAVLAVLAKRVTYAGNPGHKANPGNFGLTPPASSRADKSLCDSVGVLDSHKTLRLLREGIRRGLVSEQVRNAGQ